MNDPIRDDPVWPQVEQVMQRYAASRTAQLEYYDDGSSAWEMETHDDLAHDAALAGLEQLRRDLNTRHPTEAVTNAMAAHAYEVLNGPAFEPGVDCDGITPYEPYGSPATEVMQALQVARERDELAGMSITTLAEQRDQLRAEISEAHSSDSFATARQASTRLNTLDAFLKEKGLFEQVQQWEVESRQAKVIGPRQPGGTYRDGFSGTLYRVDDVARGDRARQLTGWSDIAITRTNLDGHARGEQWVTHLPWQQADTVVSQPPATGGPAATGAAAAARTAMAALRPPGPPQPAPQRHAAPPQPPRHGPALPGPTHGHTTPSRRR